MDIFDCFDMGGNKKADKKAIREAQGADAKTPLCINLHLSSNKKVIKGIKYGVFY